MAHLTVSTCHIIPFHFHIPSLQRHTTSVIHMMTQSVYKILSPTLYSFPNNKTDVSFLSFPLFFSVCVKHSYYIYISHLFSRALLGSSPGRIAVKAEVFRGLFQALPQSLHMVQYLGHNCIPPSTFQLPFFSQCYHSTLQKNKN